jgi:hypothetical protein
MLTPEQLQAAADEVAAQRQALAADLDAQIAWEAQRDKLAWEMIRADRTLPLDQAKARATEQLKASEPSSIQSEVGSQLSLSSDSHSEPPTSDL